MNTQATPHVTPISIFHAWQQVQQAWHSRGNKATVCEAAAVALYAFRLRELTSQDKVNTKEAITDLLVDTYRKRAEGRGLNTSGERLRAVALWLACDESAVHIMTDCLALANQHPDSPAKQATAVGNFLYERYGALGGLDLMRQNATGTAPASKPQAVASAKAKGSHKPSVDAVYEAEVEAGHHAYLNSVATLPAEEMESLFARFHAFVTQAPSVDVSAAVTGLWSRIEQDAEIAAAVMAHVELMERLQREQEAQPEAVAA